MRLGQLAKKYEIPVKEIIAYLEEQTGEKFHPNAKLYDTIESQVFEHFDLQPESTPEHESVEEIDDQVVEIAEPTETEEVVEVVSKEIEEDKFPTTPEEEIAALEGELATPEESREIEHPIEDESVHETRKAPSEDEIIQTDKLLEMLESEEIPAELEKIKLIKAPKKELSGLKVLGKVDLPEPKKKEEKVKEFVTEKDLQDYRNPRKKRQPLTEEEKEKRRLKAKNKKEAYEAREEKRRIRQQEQEQKARKEAHYKLKLEQAKSVEVKRKAKQQIAPKQEGSENAKPKPKTMLGKFWRWMNT